MQKRAERRPETSLDVFTGNLVVLIRLLNVGAAADHDCTKRRPRLILVKRHLSASATWPRQRRQKSVRVETFVHSIASERTRPQIGIPRRTLIKR